MRLHPGAEIEVLSEGVGKVGYSQYGYLPTGGGHFGASEVAADCHSCSSLIPLPSTSLRQTSVGPRMGHDAAGAKNYKDILLQWPGRYMLGRAPTRLFPSDASTQAYGGLDLRGHHLVHGYWRHPTPWHINLKEVSAAMDTISKKKCFSHALGYILVVLKVL